MILEAAALDLHERPIPEHATKDLQGVVEPGEGDDRTNAVSRSLASTASWGSFFSTTLGRRAIVAYNSRRARCRSELT
jgi:hypothetical protein